MTFSDCTLRRSKEHSSQSVHGQLSIMETGIPYKSKKSSVFSLQPSVLSLQSWVCSLESAVLSLQSSVCSFQSSVFSLQSSVCSLQCAVFILQFSVFRLQSSAFSLSHFIHHSMLESWCDHVFRHGSAWCEFYASLCINLYIWCYYQSHTSDMKWLLDMVFPTKLEGKIAI